MIARAHEKPEQAGCLRYVGPPLPMDGVSRNRTQKSRDGEVAAGRGERGAQKKKNRFFFLGAGWPGAAGLLEDFASTSVSLTFAFAATGESG